MAPPKVRFAMFDLDSCLMMAKAVHDNGGLLSSAQLAFHLGYKSDNNGSFNTRLANSRLFGLLDGPSSAITPSARALAILHPDFPETATRARVEAFEAVPLCRAVLDEYEGKPLPDETGLRNALTTRWGISTDKAPAVLARLLDSAEQAGLFSTTGNRSRMIRPTTGQPRSASTSAPEAAGPASPSPAPSPAAAHSNGSNLNRLLAAALEELPPVGDTTEQQLSQWLDFFEGAVRVVYRLPKEEGA